MKGDKLIGDVKYVTRRRVKKLFTIVDNFTFMKHLLLKIDGDIGKLLLFKGDQIFTCGCFGVFQSHQRCCSH